MASTIRRFDDSSRRRPLGCFLLLFCTFGVNLAARCGRQRISSKKSSRGAFVADVLTFGRSGNHTTTMLSTCKRPPQYSWQARVDRVAGIARSLETSNVPVDSRLARTARSNGNGKADFMVELADAIFSEYPLWLSRFRVTCGVLQTVADKRGGYQIRARPFGIQIINFGVSMRHSVTFRNENGLKCCDSTVILPITGGLASLAGPRGNRGALKFTLRAMRAKEECGDSALTPVAERTDYRIVTEIADYCPMLCGSGTPINPLRAGVYLGTQSILHGYIMWRFHRHCREYAWVHRSVP